MRAPAVRGQFVSRRMTLAQWGEMDEDDEGELVDGVLEEEEMPTYLHELVVRWFIVLLDAWARKHRGSVVGSEAKIAVGPRGGRKPDLSMFVGALPGLEDTLIRVAPHTVVEVISRRPRDARRDRVEKLRDYARVGAKHYWIVDSGLRSFEVLALERGRYSHVLDATTGKHRIPGYAGLVVDLDAVWAEIDRGEKPSRPRTKGRSGR